MALFSKFFGKTISEAAAFGLGGAIRSPLEPPLTELTNETWSKFVDAGITVPTDPGDAAEIAAEDVASEAWAKDQGRQRGYGGDQMDKLIRATRNAPGLGTLLELVRRKFIDDGLFVHGLNKNRLEPDWNVPLRQLATRLLELAPIAEGIQRGLVNPPFNLPYTPPGDGGNIPAFPASTLDAQAIAEGLGFTLDDLYLLTAEAGNPPGPQSLFRAKFRGAINDVDVQRGLAEGRSRQEWSPAFEADARQIPTAHEFVENRLRGYSDEAAMLAGADRHGMDAADTNLLFQNAGRPLNIHQITTGLARGGKFNPIPGELTDPYEAASHESNLKPSYYEINIANRYVYPSAFVLRSLTQTGEISQADAEQVLLFEGWEPTFAAKVAKAWATAKGSAAKEATAADLLTLWDGEKATRDETQAALEALGYSAAEAARKLDVVEARRVVGAKSSAIGDLHTSYKKGSLSTAKTVTALEALGVSAAAAAEIEQAWRVFLTAEGGAPPA